MARTRNVLVQLNVQIHSLNLEFLNLRFKNIVALTSISEVNPFELFPLVDSQGQVANRLDQNWHRPRFKAQNFDCTEVKWSLFH